MSAPKLRSAPWTQGKYDDYTLDECGRFSGFMHRQGFAYEKNPDPSAPTDPQILWISCRNSGSVSGKWTTCASLWRNSFRDAGRSAAGGEIGCRRGDRRRQRCGGPSRLHAPSFCVASSGNGETVEASLAK